MPRSTPDPSLLRAALAETAGAAVVLDRQLRVVDSTLEARELLGIELPQGTRIANLLCGTGSERPIAEALAEGRAVTARIRHPGRGTEERMLHVRTLPLDEARRQLGWLLLLDEDVLDADAEGTVHWHGILTRDANMKRLLQDVTKVARSEASTLVRGETGSGKELIARAVHAESARASGPFRAINCAALPAPLLESELFGHVRGAFTGAVRDYEGHLRLADGGTLFLDEVAELPLEIQAKLLRVLQDREVLPVGARKAIPVDVRFVAATHRSLRREVEAGRFRADLMYRLRVIPLFLPPLRARPRDISLLAEHFARSIKPPRPGRVVKRLSAGARHALEQYDWPGNVRELENAIAYAFVMGEGNLLTQAELPPEVRGEEPTNAVAESVAESPERVLDPEARRILRALQRSSGNKERAAKLLGISRVTLWRRLKALGLNDH
jgi:transcriptional regulator with PAS, ATPase and Fis domain